MNRSTIGKVIIVAALAAIFYSAYATYRGVQGFNPASIDALKKQMENDFAAKNITVTEISMLRGSVPRELAGFVKLKLPGSNEVVERKCIATMAEDKMTTSWNCQ